MAREDWTSTNIRVALVRKMDDFLASDQGRELGFTNRNQLIDYIIRDYLNKWESSVALGEKIQKARRA